MARCLHLARRSLGNSWPNPPVACVLVHEGRIAASGRTAPGGRPHAEAEALAEAGSLARGATAYVTLEPCSHFGKTPPCANALAEAGVARCVVSLQDPDPRVSGRGVTALQERGVRVETGLLADAARELLAGHASRMLRGRPRLALKVAATLDGAVGGAGRKRLAITGERSRAFVELLRSEHDAVLTGIGTALADNPLLLPRNRGVARRSPVRIVLDAWLRLPVESELALSARAAPLWVVHGPEAERRKRDALATRGARLIEAPVQDGRRLDLARAMELLSEQGLTRILAETGPRLSAALLAGGLADEVIWLAAGRLLGQSGLAAMETALGRRLAIRDSFRLGDDIASIWQPSV